jgi:prepilin-type N-terminal cleavage/methylation domain-containing protein
MERGKMKKLKLNSQARKALRGHSRGFTLVEVVIAMLLLGIIGMAVLTSLSYASTVLIIADRRATAESLAKTQMEYVKSQNYSTAEPGGVGNYTRITDVPNGYTICSINSNNVTVNCGLNEFLVGIPWDSGNNTAAPQDTGLQKIRLIVKYEIVSYNTTSQGSKLIEKSFTLEDYKRNPEA